MPIVTDTTPVATEITRPITAGKQERDLVVAIARKFPDLTAAELSTALQVATAEAESRANTRH
jgi:hypothetical protein